MSNDLTDFVRFVNVEIPKRLSTNTSPIGLPEDMVPVTTGEGLSVKFLPMGQLAAFGKSAYELAVEQGFEGDITAWLESLQGAAGAPGDAGAPGEPGPAGKSAFQSAQDSGYEGTLVEWLNSLVGPQGEQGRPGISAYEHAVDLGFVGEVEDWLASLVGPTGKSAYETALDRGFVGDRDAWLESLHGASAYQLAVSAGFEGTEAEWLAHLLGKSAYELAVETGFEGSLDEWLTSLVGWSAYQVAADNGFEGDELAWLESLHGMDGLDGESAYELALSEGFEGTLEEWLTSLKGEQGEPGEDGVDGEMGPIGLVNLLGGIDRFEDLPEPEDYDEGDAWLIEKRLYVRRDGTWIDAGDIGGERGYSAYELAVNEQDFDGGVLDWLTSLKGQDGVGLRILGTLSNVNNLPMTGNDSGDSYIIDHKMWVWDGSTWSPVGQVGPAGYSAYQLAVNTGFQGTLTAWLNSLKGKTAYQVALDNGFVGSQNQWLASLVGPQGPEGPTGPQGPQGESAAVVVLKGVVTDLDELPADAAVADGYILDQELYVWTGDDWENVGNIRGPEGPEGAVGAKGERGEQGLSAYEVAVAEGYVGDEASWLADLVGEQGLSAYDVAVIYGFEGTEEAWLASLRGPDGLQGLRGETGAPGAGLKILGRVADLSELPTDAEENDSYVVAQNLYSWIDGAWMDLGSVVGQKGDQGERGERGLQGETGPSAYDHAVENGFVGSLGDWLESLVGPEGKSAYQHAVDEGFSGTLQAWLTSLKGAAGPSAYQHAVDEGFVGTVSAWLASLKGQDGAAGERGPAYNLKGQLASVEELNQQTPEPGDTWFIQGHLWIYIHGSWEDMGDLTGPKGDRGEQGEQGETGQGFVYRGELASTEQLADVSDPQEGDWYHIGDHIYVYVELMEDWLDLGELRGRPGYSALQVAQSIDPTIITPEDFMLALVGPEGPQGERGPRGLPMRPMGELASEDALLELTDVDDGDTYLIQGHLWVYHEDDWLDFGSVQGPEGPEGPMGPGIEIHGRFESEADLPADGSLGQGYLIGTDFWVWTGEAYENVGPIQGPKGDRGAQGQRGLQGDTGERGQRGEKGDTGTLWVVLPREPSAIDGRIGDYFLNSVTQQFYRKTSDVNWAELGHLGGGNVYDAPHDAIQYVRRDGEWVALRADVEEAPVDGDQYVRKDGAWVLMQAEVEEAPKDDRHYVRHNGVWVESQADVEEAPEDGKQYVRKDGAWTEIEADLADVVDPEVGAYYVRTSEGWEAVEFATVEDMVHNAPESKKIVTPAVLMAFLETQLGIAYDTQLDDWVMDLGEIV